VHGVIDGTHLLIYTKPSIPYLEDYYYHKFGGYSMVAQVLVDFNKRFIDTCIDLLGIVNNSRVLKRSGLCQQAQYHALFDPSKGCGDGTPPYLLGNKRYPLISWIMTLYRKGGRQIILKLLHNKKHKKGHSIVKNVFSILKKTFKELLHKSISIPILARLSTLKTQKYDLHPRWRK
jgi:hypothetical protein